MKAINSPIRRPLLTGTQPVAGLWFATGGHDDDDLRQRVLAMWRSGARLYRFERGHLLVWREAEVRSCESLPGWPLRRYGQVFASAELSEAERRQLPLADLWLVQGSAVQALSLAAAEKLDPAAWVELSAWALHDTFDCSEAVAPPRLQAEVKSDIRAILGDAVPPPSPQREAFLMQALAARQAGADGRAAVKMAGALVLGGFLGLIVGMLRPVFGGGGGAGTGSGAGGRTGGIAPRRAPPPGPQRWRSWLVQLALITRVARLMGWRQAAYLRKMMKLFEDGDLHEALRHAIPLGGGKPSLGQDFGALGPRQNLALSRGETSTTSIGLGDDMETHLREVYRETFRRLDRAGRIDEAVFVLAELLKSQQEALDYLERHKRYAQAAELALAWDRSPETIVRLLALQGDWDKAVLVARRDNAFAAAIMLMEKKQPSLAAQLRLEWAEALVAKGEWLAAVEVVWSLPGARDAAAEWLLRAEAAEGELAARALVQRAQLLPDTLAHYGQHLQALRDGKDSEARLELGQALLGAKKAGSNPALQGMARTLLPSLLADRMSLHNAMASNDLNQLIRLADDPLLTADLPPLSLPASARPGVLQKSFSAWQAPEKGLQAIVDVVALKSGRYLIAQGEAGVQLINRRGDCLQYYSVPADCLVIADSHQLVLALAKRDTVWRVTRLDLVSREMTDLGVQALTHFARSFDGIGWTVVTQGRLLVLDTTRSLQDVMWQVADLPGPVLALHRQVAAEQLAMATPGGKELWRYQLPARRLQTRNELPAWCEEPEYSVLTLNGPVHVRLSAAGESLQLCYRVAAKESVVRLPETLGRPSGVALFADHDWIVAGLAYGRTVEWLLISMSAEKCCGQLSWPDAEGPAARISAEALCFFDRAGRMVRLSLLDAQIEQIVLRLDAPKPESPAPAPRAAAEAARKAEERAQAVRDALARKATEEAAAKASRE